MSRSTYEVYDLDRRSVVETGFPSRSEARQARNKLNKDYYGIDRPATKVRYVIVRGADHPFGRTVPSTPFEKAKPPEKTHQPVEEEKRTKRKAKKSKDV